MWSGVAWFVWAVIAAVASVRLFLGAAAIDRWPERSRVLPLTSTGYRLTAAMAGLTAALLLLSGLNAVLTSDEPRCQQVMAELHEALRDGATDEELRRVADDLGVALRPGPSATQILDDNGEVLGTITPTRTLTTPC